MGLQKGAAAVAAANASEKARAPRSGGRLNYFSLQDGERVLLRWLTDYNPHEENGEMVGGLAVIRQHPATPSRPKPAGFKGERWPSMLSPVCRRELDEECYICESKMTNEWGKPVQASLRYFALAALRETVQQDGRIVGVRDVMVDVERDGRTVQEPAIVVVNQPGKTFFDHLFPHYDMYGTWLDRDYAITRVGSGLETSYTVSPVDAGVTPGHDTRNPEIAAHYGAGDYCPADKRRFPILDEFVLNLASDEYYRRWIIPNPSVDPWDESSSAAPVAAAPVAAPSNDIDPAALADLASKLTPHSAAGQ